MKSFKFFTLPVVALFLLIMSCQKNQELTNNDSQISNNLVPSSSKTEFVYKGKSFIIIKENDKITTPEIAEAVKTIYTAHPNLVIDIFDDQENKVYLSDNNDESVKIRTENAPENQRANMAFKLISQTEINKAIAKYGTSGLDLNNTSTTNKLNRNIKKQLEGLHVDMQKVQPDKIDAPPTVSLRSDVPVASLWENIWFKGRGVQPLGTSDFPSTISTMSYVYYQDILGQVIGICNSNGSCYGVTGGPSVFYKTMYWELKNRWFGSFNDRASSGCFRKYQSQYTTHTMYENIDFGGRSYNVTVNILNEKCLGDFTALLWPWTVSNLNDKISSYKIFF